MTHATLRPGRPVLTPSGSVDCPSTPTPPSRARNSTRTKSLETHVVHPMAQRPNFPRWRMVVAARPCLFVQAGAGWTSVTRGKGDCTATHGFGRAQFGRTTELSLRAQKGASSAGFRRAPRPAPSLTFDSGTRDGRGLIPLDAKSSGVGTGARSRPSESGPRRPSGSAPTSVRFISGPPARN